MRPILFSLAVAVLALSACGGDGETSGEGDSAATPSGSDSDGDVGEAGSNDGNGNGGAPEGDVEQLVADLEPPNSSGTLSRSAADGIIYISWETPESLDDLQGFYEDAIADAGYAISSAGSAGVSYEWIFGTEGGSDFRGVVTVSPGNGGSIVAVQVGSGT
jgi:hypothetical protein